MTVGLPGAGIGGLFYLASTLLLPVRSLVDRMRGQVPRISLRRQSHSVLIAVGIIALLWLTGWLLGLVMPAQTLASASGSVQSIASRNAIPIATFGLGVGTLVMVLVAVELAHRLQATRLLPPPARRLPGKDASR